MVLFARSFFFPYAMTISSRPRNVIYAFYPRTPTLFSSVIPRAFCFVEWRHTRREMGSRVDFHRDTMMNAVMSASGRETAWFVALCVVYGTLYTRSGLPKSSGLRDFAFPRLFSLLSLSLSRCFSSGERENGWIYSRSISRDFLPVNLRCRLPTACHRTTHAPRFPRREFARISSPEKRGSLEKKICVARKELKTLRARLFCDARPALSIPVSLSKGKCQGSKRGDNSKNFPDANAEAPGSFSSPSLCPRVARKSSHYSFPSTAAAR